MPDTPRAVWPPDSGPMSRLIREHDWATSPLGDLAHWPASMRVIVDMQLVHGSPMVSLWGPQLVPIYNDRHQALLGLEHAAGLGQTQRECWPEVWHSNAPIYARVLAGETLSFQDATYLHTRHEALEDARFTLSYSPLRDETGRIAGVLVTAMEVTERMKATRALRESEARFRALTTASSDMLYRMSPDWSEMRELRGRGVLTDTEKPRHSWVDTYILAEDRPRVLARIGHAIRTRSTFELEHRVMHADGSVGWASSRAVPLFDEQGEITEWFGLAADITVRKAAEQERERTAALLLQVDRMRRVLVAEIQHRARNLLAIVRATVVQSLHASSSLGEAKTRIVDRLAALSRVHTLLSRSEVPSVTVRELVEMEFKATTSAGSGQVVLEGPEVTLPGRAVRTFSLALHELMTNAVKHGALREAGQGRVRVTWGIRDGARLFLEWVETGGMAAPPLPDAPRGFGRELIEQALPYELDAQTRLDIDARGVRCSIEFTLDEVGP